MTPENIRAKTCFITGVNSGIGEQASIQLAEAGFHVIIGARNRKCGETALSEIKEKSLNNTSGKYFQQKNKIVKVSTYIMNKNNIDVVIDIWMRCINT